MGNIMVARVFVIIIVCSVGFGCIIKESAFEKGKKEYGKTNYDQALSYLHQAILTDKNDDEAYYYRGLVYLKKAELDKAVNDFNEAISISNKPDYYADRSSAYNQIGRFDLAVEDCNYAISLNSNLSNAFMNRGYAYFSVGEDEKGLADTTRAIELDDKNYIAHNNRGYYYLVNKNYEAAIDDFKKTVSVQPEDPNTNDNLGQAYYENGQFEEAISIFNRVIEHSPDNHIFYQKRGNAYTQLTIKKRGDFIGKAIDDYTAALKIMPDEPTALRNRGYAYFLGNNFEFARKDFLESIKQNPDGSANGPVFYNLSLMAYFDKNYDEASYYLNECDKTGYDVPLQYRADLKNSGGK